MSVHEKSDEGEQDSSHNNWFRSIPRRLRRLVSTRQHRIFGRGQRNSYTSDISDPNDFRRTVLQEQTTEPDLDTGDEANVYLMVDYLGNDAEIAMIRACSQMSK